MNRYFEGEPRIPPDVIAPVQCTHCMKVYDLASVEVVGRYGDGPPQIFETMVFGGPLDNEMDRYSTWDEALKGHVAMVDRAVAAAREAQ